MAFTSQLERRTGLAGRSVVKPAWERPAPGNMLRSQRTGAAPVPGVRVEARRLSEADGGGVAPELMTYLLEDESNPFPSLRTVGLSIPAPRRVRDPEHAGPGQNSPATSAPSASPALHSGPPKGAHAPDEGGTEPAVSSAATPRRASVAAAVPPSGDDAGSRAQTATMLAQMLSTLPSDGTGPLHKEAIAALETLARDEAALVREALAGAVKDIVHAPPSVVQTLARDIEQRVAQPILKECRLLSDQDLLSILRGRTPSWKLQAIAGRTQVSAVVADAIHAQGDVEATGVLIDNQGAELTEPTLARMTEESAKIKPWQEKLAMRPALPKAIVRRLSEVVDASVLDLLKARKDIDTTTARQIMVTARRRLDWLDVNGGSDPALKRAARLHKAGRLDEDSLTDALSWDDHDFVRAGLSLLAGCKMSAVDSILNTRSARLITSLAWRAGLSMRGALALQTRLAGLSGPDLLNARDGKYYPLPESEMARRLATYISMNGRTSAKTDKAA